MTIKLYEQDAYMRVFDATVVSCEPCKESFAVTLDQTAFFPEGGGQPADGGTLGDAVVQNVQIADGVIVHTTDRPFAVGERVRGVLDWETRFSRMQHHTGEHVISGLFHTMYGLDNVGFHLNDTLVTLDVSGALGAEQLAAAELAANRIVHENRAVTARFPSAEELPTLVYRSKLDLIQNVRLITIEGCDVCACCAPHVSRTGEIGLIKIIGAMPYKGGMRLTMLCGERAFADYARLHAANAELMHLLSAPRDKVVDFVANEHVALSNLRAAFVRLQDERALERLEVVRLDGIVCAFTRDASATALRACAEKLASYEALTAVFSLSDDGTARYALRASKGDVRGIARALNEAFDGRGGGKPDFAQGQLTADRADILAFWNTK